MTTVHNDNQPNVSNRSDEDKDDEEDEDEDYDPTQDTEAIEEDRLDAEQETTRRQPAQPSNAPTLYPEVDRAFLELFGYPWGTVFTKHNVSLQQEQVHQQQQPTNRATNSNDGVVLRQGRLSRRNEASPYHHHHQQRYHNESRATASTSYSNKNEILLTELFGHEAAMKIIHAPLVLPPLRSHNNNNTNVLIPPLEGTLLYLNQQQGDKQGMKGELTPPQPNQQSIAAATATCRPPLGSNTKATAAVIQDSTAGEATTTATKTKTAMSSSLCGTFAATTEASGAVANRSAPASSTTTSIAAPTPPSVSSLDVVLQELAAADGPSKLSTVAKTSVDWDAFKSQHAGTAQVLEDHAQGKDAFLIKQDFLSRVDMRRFEQEKAQRDRQRKH